MKKVCFDTSEIYHLRDVPPSSLMTHEERNRTWYNLNEMSEMKKSAKEQVHFFRVAYSWSSSSHQDVTSKEGNIVSDDECIGNSADEIATRLASNPLHFTSLSKKDQLCYRGLEARISFERMRHKSMYLHKILRACKRAQDHIQDAEARDDPHIDAYKKAASETLRSICTNESQKSREIAIHTGKSDFEFVCKNDGISVCQVPPVDVVSANKKRKSTCQAILEYSKFKKRSRIISTGMKNEEEQVQFVDAVAS